MIVTLTANPSVDRAVLLAEPLARHAVHRATSELEQPGGKGVNISRAAVAAGVATLAVLPADKDSDFVRELHALGIDCQPETPTGPIRINLTITEPDGTTTKINSAGATADESLLRRLADTVLAAADDAAWVVLAGSLPPGAPDAWYADLAARLVPARARVAVDTSEGPLLALGSRLADAAPDLMKPNAEELVQLTGRPASGPEAAAEAASELIRSGAGAVLVTLGGAGAVLVRVRRGLARAGTAHPGRQHRRRRRLEPVRLPLRRPQRRLAGGVSPARCRVRQRCRLASRHHRPCPRPDPSRPRRRTTPRLRPRRTHRMSSALITTDLVRLDTSFGLSGDDDKLAVIRALADVVGSAGRTADVAQLAEDALAREATSATGLPGGIAIPHCRTAAVDVPTLAFARLDPARDFGAKDGPADLAFLIAAPAGGDTTHLQILTKLARALVKKDFTDGLRAARRRRRSWPWCGGRRRPAAEAGRAGGRAGHGPGGDARAAQPGGRHRLPHRDRAHLHGGRGARGRRGARRGDISVETQGSAGSKPLPAQTIADADAVIFATDVGVKDRSRFAGKPMIASGVKRAIDDGDALVAQALAAVSTPAPPRVEGSGRAAPAASSSGGDESWGLRIRRVLMTGVSYMIPFVAAGGLLIALAFLLGGYEIA